MVVIGAAGSLTQADIMSAALASAGIEAMIVDENATNLLGHINIAVNPRGIRIAVPARDAENAARILKGKDDGWGSIDRQEAAEPSSKVTEERLSADQCARKAYYAAFFSWWLPPIAVVTAFWFAKAVAVRRDYPPENAGRFRRRMLVAFFLGILVPTCATIVILLAVG